MVLTAKITHKVMGQANVKIVCWDDQDDLTFVHGVCCEGERVWRYEQAPQFAQEHSKHSHCQALVLRMVQEVHRTVNKAAGI